MAIITSDNPLGAGRPTELTDELFDKIRELVLEGKTLREISSLTQINEGTLYQWHSKNYSNLADKIEGWKRDRLINLAEGNVKAILEMGVTDKESLKVVQDTAKFVLETLKKDKYSKRTEQTGADGQPLSISIAKEIVDKNALNTNDTSH